jgi:hypothetical protein
MAADNLYISQGQIGELRAPSATPVEPSALPPSGGLEKIGEATAGLAEAGAKVYGAIKSAQEHTTLNVTTADYLTKLDALEQAHTKDPDYQNAPTKFAEGQRELELDAASKIEDGRLRQMAILQWRRAGIAAGKRVQHAAYGRESDANTAALDTQGQEALTSASSAGSPTERQDVVDRYLTTVEASPWITEQQKVARALQFGRSLDTADVMRDMRRDPAAAKASLDDPKNYPHLDPVTRENFRNSAANASDQVAIDRIAQLAESDPVAARESVEKAGLQPHSYYRALQTIDQVQKQHEATLDREAKSAAQAARDKDDVKELIKQGYEVDPVRIETVRNANIAAAARGDRAAGQYVSELDLQIQLQPHVRQAWSMPVAALDAAVHHMEAQMTVPGANVTGDQVMAYRAFKSVRDEIMQKRDAEPIVLGGEHGARYYKLNPIDPAAAPDDPVFRRELAQRNAHAATAQEVYGGLANALTAEETRAFKDRYGKAGPDEQFNLVRALGASLSGRAYSDTLAAVAGNDNVTAFAGELAQTRPELAREIMQGQAILGDAKTKEKSIGVRAVLASKMPTEIYPVPALQETAISAALALDAARRGSKGGLYDAADTSNLDQAIEDVTGPIVRRNGNRFPIAPAVGRPAFIGALDHLTKSDVALMGGATDRNGKPIEAAWLGDHAILKPLSVGGARYAVGLSDPRARDGFAPVLDFNGAPLVFDMAAIATNQRRALANVDRPQPLIKPDPQQAAAQRALTRSQAAVIPPVLE